MMTIHSIYRLLIWLVFLLGLMMSCITSYLIKCDIDAYDYQQFVFYCQEVKSKINTRLETQEQMLLSAAAMFIASEQVTRDEWQVYAERLRINEHFNGIQGLGFALWLSKDALPAHEALIQKQGFPEYHVHPEGQRDFYAPVIYLEPFEKRNLRAFGYDVYSEPTRRTALEKARDENAVALTGKVTLVQEQGKEVQAGTLMYAPVYKKAMPINTVEQRRAAIYGWVNSPFRMKDLLENIVFSSHDIDASLVRLLVYDGKIASPEHLLYDSNPNFQTAKYHRHSTFSLQYEFKGRIWTLEFEQSIALYQINYQKIGFVFGAGVIVTVLVFLLLLTYLNTHLRAVEIAKELTKKLQESEKRFRVLADSAPVLIWLSGVDKLCYQFNKIWLEFTGRTLEQEYGNGWAEGVHPDDFQRCLDTYTTAFDARQSFTMEYRLRRYDGEYRWILDQGEPRFADEGTFLGYIGSCIDITDRKQLEADREKSLSLLSATLESSSNAILVVDLNNTWVLHNQQFINLWHISDELIQAKDDANALHFVLAQLQDPKAFFDKVQELYNTPEANSFDIICFKNGRVVERYSMPQRINGEVVGRVWSFHDVTERTNAEHELIKESEKNRALLRNASDGIHILDPNGNIIECSDSFCQMLGYAREQMLGMNVTQWDANFSPEDCSKVVKAQFDKKTRCQFETRHRCKDGHIIDVEVSGFALKLDGKPVLFNSSRDITERKHIENALNNSQMLLKTAQRAAHLGHYVIDLTALDKNNATWTNDALFNEVFGIDEQFPHTLDGWLSLIHPDDKTWVIEKFRNFVLHHRVSEPSAVIDTIRYRIIRPCDGVERWIEVWAYNFYDANNQPTHQVGMIQDITERKQTEEKIKASEALTKSIINSLTAHIAVLDAQGVIIKVNNAWQQFGVDNGLFDELIGENYLELCKKAITNNSDDDINIKLMLQGIQSVLTGDSLSYGAEYACHSMDQQRWFYMTVVPLQNENGGVVISHENITERKLAEQALKQRESYQRALLDNFPFLVWLKDKHSHFLAVNRLFAQAAGQCCVEDLFNKTDLDIWPAELAMQYRADDQAVMNFGGPKNVEELVEVEGERIWFETYKSPVFVDHQIVGTVGFARDITERKLAEDALKRSEARFRATIEASPIPIALCDKQGCILFFNNAFIQIFGYTADDISSLNDWFIRAYPDAEYRQSVVEKWHTETVKAQQEQRNLETFEVKICCKDGSVKNILVSGTSFSDDNQAVNLAMFSDITALKQAELKEIHYRQQLENTIVGTHAGTWEWNVQTGEVQFNEVWAEIIGYTLEELQPISLNTWINLCHPDDLQKSNELLQRHFAGELEYYDCECRIKHKDGHWVWVFDKGKVVSYDDQGKALLMAGTHLDITSIKQTEEQLRIAATVFESQSGMMVADANRQVLKVNRAFTEITGYHSDELIGKTPRLFHSGRQDNLFYQRMWHSINTTGTWQGEIWNKRQNGEDYPAWLSITAVSKNQIVTHYVSTLNDISELKQIENELRESQVLLQTAQRAAMLGHYVLDLNTKTWANDALFDEIFGINEDFERELQNLKSLIHPDDLEFVKQNFSQVFEYKKISGYLTGSMEHRIIRPSDGKECWIGQWGSTFYDEKGQAIRQIGMIQDITERKTIEEQLKASKEHFRSIIEGVPVPMFLNDGQDNLIFINPAFTKAFGYELHEIPTLASWREKAYPDVDYRNGVVQLWQDRLKQAEMKRETFQPLELNIRSKKGKERIILATATPLQGFDFSKQHLVMLYDITERKRAETELRIAATVFESQEGMVITDANETILNVNRAFTQITGYTAEEMIGQTPRILKSERHNADFYNAIWQSLKDTGAWQGEVWNRRKSGEVYPEQLTITAVKNDDNIITHYVATMTDITERKATEEYIYRLAFYDALTQLPNRRLLQQRLTHSIKLYKRNRTKMAVLMMDLDKFKAVNDTLGHAAGDELLIQVAQRIKARLREVDLVARLGGDEFVILLEDIKNYDGVSLVADAVIKTLTQQFILNEKHHVHIGASIGIAIHPEHGDTEEALMDNADMALYKAKDLGRGCFVYFSDDLRVKQSL